jgi:hypothetical protein
VPFVVSREEVEVGVDEEEGEAKEASGRWSSSLKMLLRLTVSCNCFDCALTNERRRGTEARRKKR